MLLKLYMKSSKLFMILTILLNVVDAQDELERMTHPMEHAPAEVFLKILLVEFSDVSHDINYSATQKIILLK